MDPLLVVRQNPVHIIIAFLLILVLVRIWLPEIKWLFRRYVTRGERVNYAMVEMEETPLFA